MENTKLRSKTLNLEADPGPLILPIVRSAPTKSGSNSALQCEINPDPVLILVVSSRSSSSTMTTKYTSRDQAAPCQYLRMPKHQDQAASLAEYADLAEAGASYGHLRGSTARDQSGSCKPSEDRIIIPSVRACSSVLLGDQTGCLAGLLILSTVLVKTDARSRG